MRALVVVVLTGALLWCGYWFVGSQAMERGVADWFDRQQAAGLTAERSDVAVLGFPNRFDLTVTEPRLADPRSGLGWSAPFVQVLTLSYAPSRLIVAFAPEQSVDLPGQTLRLVSGKLQASAALDSGAGWAPEDVRLVGDALNLRSSLGWAVTADTARAAMRRLDESGTVQEVGLEFLGLGASLPEGGAAGVVLDRVHVDAEVQLSGPLDGRAEVPPVVTGVTMQTLSLAAGEIDLTGSGRLTADAAGYAEGRIALRLTNWRQLLALAVDAGLVTPEVAPTWANALSLLADQSGDPQVLELPLTFRAGRASLGPLPIGPAPRLR